MRTPPKNWKLHFGSLLAGQAVSLFGSSLVQFALVWYLTQTTGSATVLATATLAATLPGIFLGPPANAFWFAMGAMALAAVMQPITNGPLMAILQATVAPAMQGRVFSLVQAGATAMTPIGLIIAGPVADRFGVQSWFLFSGAVCVFMTLAAFFSPALLNIEAHAPSATPAGVEGAVAA